MKIVDYLKEDCINTNLKSRDKKSVLKEMIKMLEKNGYIKDSEKILEAVMDREKLGSTGIGQGIAIPHVKTDQVNEIICALGLSQTGVDFDSLDGEPVYIIFLVLAPTKSIGQHLKTLAKIARLLKDKVFRNALRSCKTPEEAIKIIKEDEEKLNSLS
ncbi:MAG: PTS sugar transporter subunit IIA [Candidatus Omnitrophica bacterium]|nr:PTS sugar transporter subunit IIA [Candidatus Omnitrophota bacterium]MCM8808860.1 PTS sugar transporter subunit IIA [Candidatus Omnitrophota bacterium]MCM8810801.1 PTS sugar transporter subunit IIA [Candidatus Omnitrophota bacterium]MCM8832368.1 PTS sugar transporter subunit IIA [Candidatus Omnitrophota bacterium]